MRTKPADGVAFGYKSPLKTLYIKGVTGKRIPETIFRGLNGRFQRR